MVLASLLADGRSSRLVREFVDEAGVASEVEADAVWHDLGGRFSVRTIMKRGHDPKEVLPLLKRELDTLRTSGPAEADLRGAIRRVTTRRLEDVESFAARAETLASYEHYLGDPAFLPRELAQLRAVSVDDIKAFANANLPDDARYELVTVPFVAKHE
jgi:zinc protease